MSRSTLLSIALLAGAAALAPSGGADGTAPARAAAGGDAKSEMVTSVVLKRRVGNAAYDNSAYSFRYATQDLAIHKNSVDLVYSGCGLLHCSPEAGLKNRITKVTGRTLAEVDQPPTVGWMTQCIKPEAGACYVMDIDDGTTKMRVKIHLTTVTVGEIDFEWSPFHDSTRGSSSTMGQCTGVHACK